MITIETTCDNCGDGTKQYLMRAEDLIKIAEQIQTAWANDPKAWFVAGIDDPSDGKMTFCRNCTDHYIYGHSER